jgi:integrase
MKLQTAINLFLNEKTPVTREGYFYILRDAAGFLGPAREVDQIRPEHLVEYANQVMARDYTPTTIRRYVKTLKTFFNWCVNLELISRSPAHVLKARRVPAYISRDKAMSEDEFDTLVSYVRWKPRDHALILFLADTGCRARGAAGLKVEDLDLTRCHATVTEKGEKTRQVAFGEDCRTAINLWLFKRPKGAGVYVFSRTATPITSDVVSQIVRRNCLRCGIRSLGSHSLRHRKGHQLADDKIAPSIAATVLGHSDPAVTMQHYYPADWETAEKEMKKLAYRDKTHLPNVVRVIQQKHG